MDKEQNEIVLSEVLKLIEALRKIGLSQAQIDQVLKDINTK